MTITFIAQAKNGTLHLGENNAARLRDWLKKNPGKRLRIEPDEPPTYSLRKFFEGVVVKYYFYQHNIGVYKDFKDSRESLKLEFNPQWVINSKGKRELMPGSTTKKSKEWWKVFLKRIERYFDQNGYEYPDSTEYEKWINSIPDVDEIYPPLRRLIEIYKNQL